MSHEQFPQGSMSRRKFLGALTMGVLSWPLVSAFANDSELPEIIIQSGNKTPKSPTRPLSINSVTIGLPVLALTFDDGPHPTLTPRLLDILAKHQAKATFYLIGKNVATYPEIARRIVEEGHEVANHSWSHPALSKLGASRIDSELGQAHQAIIDATGVTPTTMRPPYGAVNDRVKDIARTKYNYTTVMWSVDPLDWKIRNSESVRTKLLAGAAPGAILLSHDIHPTTVDAMPGTVAGLAERGFGFNTVSGLMTQATA